MTRMCYSRVFNVAVFFSFILTGSAEPSLLLVPIDATWRYDQSGGPVAEDWTSGAFDDSSWPSGQALLGYDIHQYPEPIRTSLNDIVPGTTNGITTYYFRTLFDFGTNTAGAWLHLGLLADDGAVIYLNGTEILRRRVPTGQTHLTVATNQNYESYYEVVLVPGSALVAGLNTLAVEVHQRQPGTSDMVFGLTAWAVWPEPLQLLEGPVISNTSSNSEIRISVRVAGTDPIYQWFRNNVPISGATGPEHILFPSSPGHQGDYHVRVTNFLGSVVSDRTNLTLTADRMAPEIVQFFINDFLRAINFTWSEPLDRGSVSNRANYTLTYHGSTNSLIVTQANAAGTIMQLRGISPWEPGRDFVLSINGLTDVAGNALTNTRIWISRRTSTFVDRSTNWRHHRDPVFGDLSHNWKTANFDDTGWPMIRGYIASTNAVVGPGPYNRVDFVSPTWLFRTPFVMPGDARFARFNIANAIDDGAVYYLNGKEVFRFNLPPGPVYFGTLSPSNAMGAGSVSVIVTNLVRGTNVLAVSVHQSADQIFSTAPRQDLVFATDVSGFIITTNIPPFLYVEPQGNQAILTWTEEGYALETTTALDGEWTELPSTGKTHTVDPTDSQRFYRLREIH